jgi:hypothetical protein
MVNDVEWDDEEKARLPNDYKELIKYLEDTTDYHVDLYKSVIDRTELCNCSSSGHYTFSKRNRWMCTECNKEVDLKRKLEAEAHNAYLESPSTKTKYCKCGTEYEGDRCPKDEITKEQNKRQKI